MSRVITVSAIQLPASKAGDTPEEIKEHNLRCIEDGFGRALPANVAQPPSAVQAGVTVSCGCAGATPLPFRERSARCGRAG